MKDLKKLFIITIKNKNFWKALIAIIIAFIVYFILPESCPESGKRTAFVFVIAAFFWALEIIPLYATSLVVVISLILFLLQPWGPLDIPDLKRDYEIFLIPFSSPIIILFFGGFVLAIAMHKFKLDSKIARNLLKIFGTRPSMILVGFMVTTAFLSMWMSNTATTAMMLVMIAPLVAQLDAGNPFKKGLILAIPFGANIGGCGTPVGTPPNAIAIGLLSDYGITIDFLTWMKIAIPYVIIMLIIASAILYFMFKPTCKELVLKMEHEGKLGIRAKSVAIISLITILLWLTSKIHHIPDALVALIAAGLLFTFSILDRNDMKKIDWDVLVLMWGGLALGKGMEVSKLTEWIVSLPLFSHEGLILIAIFSVIAFVLASFMSHTAAANLVIPLVVSIPDPLVLAIAVTLSCSFAMALPISTPPNAMAFASGAIKSKDMVISGTIISVIAVILVILTGHLIINFVLGTN